MMKESLENLRAFMEKSFVCAGVPKADARVCAEVINAADRRGIDSHGVGRFKPFYMDRIKAGIQQPVTRFEVLRDVKATAVVDGHDGMGHVIAKRAMQMAMAKAKEHGLGMVAVRNSTHYGIAGYYTMMAAAENMIGITGTNARPTVAPTFGAQGKFGTNPLTFSLPTDEAFPFVPDFASSIAQTGKLEHYARIGKPLPMGWVIDNRGRPVTDAKAAQNGVVDGSCMLLPLGGAGEEMGGYKGYNYATIVEILCSALQQGSFLGALNGLGPGGERRPYHLGHFFIAVDIACFIEPAQFKKNVGDLLRELRAAKKADGQERIYTAGEKEHYISLEREKNGVPLNETLVASLMETRAEWGVDFKFSWEE